LRDKHPRSLHRDLAEINFPAKASNSKELTMNVLIATSEYGFFQPIHDIFKVHGYAGLAIFAVAFCLTASLFCKLDPYRESRARCYMAALLLCYVAFFSFEVEFWQNRVTKYLRHSQARREQRSSPSEQ
jgi:hypothetical protein